MEKGWINTLLLAGQSQPLTLTLPGGEYLFVLNTASGISVLTGYTLAISRTTPMPLTVSPPTPPATY